FSLKRSDFTKENLNSFLAGTAYGADQNITFGWIAWATGAEERDDDYFFMLAKTGTDVFCLGLFVEAGATLGSIAASGTSIGSGMVAFGMAASPAGGYSLSIAGVGVAVSEVAAASAIGAAGVGCMAVRTADFLQKDASKVHKMESKLREGMENVDYKVSDKVWKDVGKKKIKGLQEKFKNAADKGIVGPQGQEGIKEIKGFKYKGVSYNYEIKIKGKGVGDFRIYGNKNADGVIEFTKFGTH
ncbi:MAG: hypothetical protein N4A43_04680, partial [Alphaproteobacteria bacterium]|nr:hypothetical protein [Alphaproteobacteria bacterium]